MGAFQAGTVAVLVATTVIEVGVDVPNATLIVIEGAERFGLAQLHQLRGRVGRGSQHSTCLLLRGNALSETSRSRLALMRESNDGFRIAEEDLRLRGGGELLGTRQSGEAGARLADAVQTAALIETAHADARLLTDRDGGLEGRGGRRRGPCSICSSAMRRWGCCGRVSSRPDGIFPFSRRVEGRQRSAAGPLTLRRNRESSSAELVPGWLVVGGAGQHPAIVLGADRLDELAADAAAHRPDDPRGPGAHDRQLDRDDVARRQRRAERDMKPSGEMSTISTEVRMPAGPSSGARNETMSRCARRPSMLANAVAMPMPTP